MELTINERTVESTPEDGETLEALLDGLRRRGEIGRDQVVVGLCVDRRDWRAEDMDRLDQVRLEQVREVAIATDELAGYAGRILTDAAGMVEVLREGTHRLAAQFRSGDPEKANAGLFSLLTALQRLLACIYHVKNTCGAESPALEDPAALLDGLLRGLDLIQLSQEGEDWAALAAQLETEMLPALDGIEGALRDLSHAI